MKMPKEIRQWVNRRRSAEGKRNGVVSWLWDAPVVEVMLQKSKKNYRRQNRKPHGAAN